jgi:hypothetical protein
VMSYNNPQKGRGFGYSLFLEEQKERRPKPYEKDTTK